LIRSKDTSLKSSYKRIPGNNKASEKKSRQQTKESENDFNIPPSSSTISQLIMFEIVIV
jgi:hypothetical protein